MQTNDTTPAKGKKPTLDMNVDPNILAQELFSKIAPADDCRIAEALFRLLSIIDTPSEKSSHEERSYAHLVLTYAREKAFTCTVGFSEIMDKHAEKLLQATAQDIGEPKEEARAAISEDDMPRDESPDSSTDDRQQKVRQAAALTRRMLVLLEYDMKNLDLLLLLLDLFESNSHDAMTVDLMAAEARQLAFGMSPLAEDQGHEYIRKLREAAEKAR
jgi:hypothetical protein